MKEVIHIDLCTYLHIDQANPEITAMNMWEDKYTIFVAYFVEKNVKELNELMSQMLSVPVASDVIICKMKLSYKIDGNNIACDMTPETLSIYEVNETVHNLFIKNGLIVEANGNIRSYRYITEPFEELMLNEPDYDKHYRYHEYEMFTNVIRVIVDTRSNEQTSSYNETISWLCGKRVYGTVYVGMYKKPEYNENPPFISLNSEIFDKIIKLKKISRDAGNDFTKPVNQYANFLFLVDIELDKCKNDVVSESNSIDSDVLNNVV